MLEICCSDFSMISHFLERILIEHINMKNSLDFKLQVCSMCFIRIRSKNKISSTNRSSSTSTKLQTLQNVAKLTNKVKIHNDYFVRMLNVNTKTQLGQNSMLHFDYFVLYFPVLLIQRYWLKIISKLQNQAKAFLGEI